MPSYRTHLIFAGIIWIFVMVFFFHLQTITPTLIASIIVALLGGLLPDLDAQQSKINNYVELGIGIFILLSFLLWYTQNNMSLFIYATIAAVFLIAIQFTRHRGSFHTIEVGAILAIPLYFVQPLFVGALVVGYFSHLLLDNML